LVDGLGNDPSGP